MINPHFGKSWFVTGEMYRYPTKLSVVTRVPLFVARANSALVVKRAFLGSTIKSGAALLLTQKDERGPWHGVLKELHVLRELPCVRGSRASWRDDEYLVGRCALSW
jgi:hypothetical protein